jgi:hypothetical protein
MDTETNRNLMEWMQKNCRKQVKTKTGKGKNSLKHELEEPAKKDRQEVTV